MKILKNNSEIIANLIQKLLMNINNIKNKIKANPALIFKKPWYFLYIPIIVFTILKNRFIADEDRIFFVESGCNKFLIENKNLKIVSDNYRLKEINSFEDFLPYFNKRIAEESDENSIIYRIKVESFFKNKSVVFVLINNDLPIGYIFTQTENTQISQVNLQVPLSKETFSLFDTYIFKESRGNNLSGVLYYSVIEKMNSRGFNDYCIWFFESNQRSLKAHVKIEIRHINKIITRRKKFFVSKIIVENKSFDMAELIKNYENTSNH
jgi:hypothetical protein